MNNFNSNNLKNISFYNIFSLLFTLITLFYIQSNGISQRAMGFQQNPIHATCEEDNGVLEFQIIDGTPPFNVKVTLNGTDLINQTGVTTRAYKLEDLADGDYEIAITDAASDLVDPVIRIKQRGGLIDEIKLDQPILDARCNESNGEIYIDVLPKTYTYTYEWKNSAGVVVSTDEDPTGLSDGNYTVTVTSEFGCKSSKNFTVGKEEKPVIDMANSTIEDEHCSQVDGSIELSGQNLSNVSILWNDPANSTTPIIQNLAAGNYKVVLTTPLGCEVEADFDVKPIDAPTLSEVVFHPNCGEINGEIDLTVTTQEAGPHSYDWTTPTGSATTEDLTDLDIGVHRIKVTTQAGCSVEKDIDLIRLPKPTIELVGGTTDPATCGDNSGRIEIIVNNTSENYTIRWDKDPRNSLILDNLSAGDYTVTITTETNCSVQATYTVEGKNMPIVTLLDNIPEKCDATDGSLEIDIQSTDPVISILWNDPAQSTTKKISNLDAGSYNVVVKTQHCEVSKTFIVADEKSPIITAISTNEKNKDGQGKICVSHTEGTGVITYRLYLKSDLNNEITSITTGCFTNLSENDYVVIATDENGCLSAAVDSKVENDVAQVDFTTRVEDVTCGNTNDGIIFIKVSTTVPFRVKLRELPNGVFTEITLSNPVGQEYLLDNLTAGNYEIKVYEDQNEATNFVIKQATVGAETDCAPDCQITMATQSFSANCDVNDGKIVFTVNNAKSPFVITITNNDDQSTIIMAADDINQDNLPAGDNYEAKIVDAEGCELTKSFKIAEFACDCDLSISEITADHKKDLCGTSSGEFAVQLTGVTGNINYTLEDPQGNVIPFDNTTLTAKNLAAGTYKLTVTDDGNSNCDPIELNITIEADDLTALTTHTDENCKANDGTAEVLSVNGSTNLSQYSFLWNDVNAQTTSKATGLKNGNYDIVISLGTCNLTKSVTINEVGCPSCNGFTASAHASDATCGNADGSVIITTSGGQAPYTYAWNAIGSGSNPSNLPKGSYDVTITDDNGCTFVISAIQIDETGCNPACSLDATTVDSDETCTGNDGSIDLSTTGGVAPITYSWSNGQTTEDIASLTAGTYTCIVTDGNNCTKTVTVTLKNTCTPCAISISETIQDANCGQNDGAITLAITGTTNASYIWSNGANTKDIQNVGQGNYTVIVTDGPCADTATFTVGAMSNGTVNTENINEFMCEGDEYDFNGVPITTPGEYADTLQNKEGCDSVIIKLVMNGLPSPKVNAIADDYTIYLGEKSNVNFSNRYSNGSRFMWNFGDGTFSPLDSVSHTYTKPKTYEVILEGTLGSCIAYDTLFIRVLDGVGINENNLDKNIKIYPNPSTDVINVSVDLSESTDLKIDLINLDGRIIQNELHTSTVSINTQFNISELAKGLYIIKVTSDGVSSSKRIIIQ